MKIRGSLKGFSFFIRSIIAFDGVFLKENVKEICSLPLAKMVTIRFIDCL